MKKFKSLLSLLFVMVLMLQMVGPMAFADEPYGTEDNPYPVTIAARNPYFDTEKGEYVHNGYTVYNEVTEKDIAGLGIIPEDFEITVELQDGDDEILAVINYPDDVFQATTGNYYEVVDSRDGSAQLKRITVKATTPAFVGGKYTSSYEIVGEKHDPSHNADGVPTITVGSGSVTAEVNREVQIYNSESKNVTGMYILSYQDSTISLDKPTITVAAAKPSLGGDGVFYPNGLASDGGKVTIDGKEYAYVIHSYIDIDQDTGIATPYDAYITYNGTDITDLVNIEYESAEVDRPVINIFAKKAVKNSDGTYSANGFADDTDSLNPKPTITVHDWIVNTSNGKVVVTPGKVTVALGSNDATKNYKVIKHPSDPIVTGNDNNNNNDDDDNDTTTKKTKLVIMAVDADKAYNGKAFTKSQAQGVKFINGTSLLSGHSIGEGLKIQYTRRSDGFTFTDYTDVTKVGTYDKELIVLSSKVIVDEDGKDVTSQYDITAVDGILTIYKAGYVSPDTGDHSNMGLWITLLAVSAVAVAAAVVIILKKSKKA